MKGFLSNFDIFLAKNFFLTYKKDNIVLILILLYQRSLLQRNSPKTEGKLK
jgi:hypothetical protein